METESQPFFLSLTVDGFSPAAYTTAVTLSS